MNYDLLVDTNVLIYALNSSAKKHERALRFMQENHLRIVLAQQNILEMQRVMTHTTFPQPMTSLQAANVSAYLEKTYRVLSPRRSTISIHNQLLQTYMLSGNRIFDLYLVATALSHGVSHIATYNTKDFEDIEEISLFDLVEESQ